MYEQRSIVGPQQGLRHAWTNTRRATQTDKRHKSQEGEREEETEPDEGEREDEAEQDEGEVEDEAEQITAHQAPTSAPDHAPPN